MAPTLLGTNITFHCESCGILFKVDAEFDRRLTAYCPACGGESKYHVDYPVEFGTSVEIESFAEINRFDVVAFEFEQSERFAVKRAIGLPDETIELRDGDIFANGKRVIRPFVPWHSKRIPVSEKTMDILWEYREGKERPRWEPVDAAGWHWDKEQQNLTFRPDKTNPENGYLFFRPGRCYARTEGIEFFTDSIEDFYGFNQGISRVEMNVVEQLVVYTQVFLDEGDQFSIFIRDGDVYRMGTFAGDANKECERLCFAVLDGQVYLARDGKLLVQGEVEDWPSRTLPDSVEGPVALLVESENESTELHSIKIERDFYYFPASPDRNQFVLKDDEYFMLGDNPPVSVDSRNWQNPGVKINRIFGKVLVESAN